MWARLLWQRLFPSLSALSSACASFLKSPREYRVHLSNIRIDWLMLKQIISNGLPAGLQNSIISLANVVVSPTLTNSDKWPWPAAVLILRLRDWLSPHYLLCHGFNNFYQPESWGKRIPAGEKKGAVFGVICSISIAELVGVLIYFFSPYFIAAFNATPQVVSYGVAQAHVVTLFYFLLAFSHCMAGILRGAESCLLFPCLLCWCAGALSA